jgi:predicted DNA-binding transcriptional regulator AlpA
LVGSSVCAVVAALLKGVYGGDHLETLVHGAVILGSVGLVVFGLAGLAMGTRAPLGRYPMALALAFGTVVVGTLLVLRIHAEAAPPCSPGSCFRGFEDPWVQALLAFNVAFLALLFLVPAWRAPRSSWKVTDIAEFLGVSTQRVDQLALAAQFPAPSGRLGRSRYWKRSDVEAWAEGNWWAGDGRRWRHRR